VIQEPFQSLALPCPQTTVILATSADGKIADAARSPARFGSARDKAHLEAQIAKADGVLFGAETLRAYGSTLRVTNPVLLQQRQQQGRPSQPIQIVCSRSANLDPHAGFFRQPVPRWLLTTATGAKFWQSSSQFERILTASTTEGGIDWIPVFQQLYSIGLKHLAVIGGGSLVASLLAVNLVDELWLTICPLLLGGATAPTPVEGTGFSSELAPRLQLLSAEAIDQEVFLHYRLQHNRLQQTACNNWRIELP
jgi:5-amino-6-(5-phosphoribosylamino)uracil reductase